MQSPGPATPTPATEPPAAASRTITIDDFAFAVPASVPAGATFDVTEVAGATGPFTAPSAAGSYDFVCGFRRNMKGTVVVE